MTDHPDASASRPQTRRQIRGRYKLMRDTLIWSQNVLAREADPDRALKLKVKLAELEASAAAFRAEHQAELQGFAGVPLIKDGAAD